MRDLQSAEQHCASLQSELDAAQAEFRKYQAMKAVEVRLLEQRVLQQLTSSGGAIGNGNGSKRAGKASMTGRPAAEVGTAGDTQPTTLADLEAACSQEGIAAALREARLERLQREQLEAALAAAQAAGEQLGARARAAEQELAAQRSQLLGEARAAREHAERLTAELTDCQQALKLAKSEGSRRLKELQALQRQAAEACENGGTNGTAAMRLEAEHAARSAAEVQLREARQALARKAALIRDLRAKVGGAVCGMVKLCCSGVVLRSESWLSLWLNVHAGLRSTKPALVCICLTTGGQLGASACSAGPCPAAG